MKKEIVPSIIAKTQKELDLRVKKIRKYCTTYQIDVMDGKFVKNTSFQFGFKLPKTKHKVEAHLMLRDPKNWIEKNFSKVDVIIIHVESFKSTLELRTAIKLIKSKKKKVGLVIKPRTQLKFLRLFIRDIDMISIMTVHPGKYGGRFSPSVLEKVRLLRKSNPNLNIEVDGGITPKTISLARGAGANQFICGSYLQKSKDIKTAFDILKRGLEK
jgi:ribulose-phosphate 3-epimerase